MRQPTEYVYNIVLEDPLIPGRYYLHEKMKRQDGCLISVNQRFDVTDQIKRIVAKEKITLQQELDTALRYLRAGKHQFTPGTTNSDVDENGEVMRIVKEKKNESNEINH